MTNMREFMNQCQYYGTTLLNNMSWLKYPSAIYILWIVGHFVAANIYAYHCTHLSFTGFFISPFITGTPYCRGILWIATKGSDVITNMWILIGTTLTTRILTYVPNQIKNKISDPIPPSEHHGKED